MAESIADLLGDVGGDAIRATSAYRDLIRRQAHEMEDLRAIHEGDEKRHRGYVTSRRQEVAEILLPQIRALFPEAAIDTTPEIIVLRAPEIRSVRVSISLADAGKPNLFVVVRVFRNCTDHVREIPMSKDLLTGLRDALADIPEAAGLFTTPKTRKARR